MPATAQHLIEPVLSALGLMLSLWPRGGDVASGGSTPSGYAELIMQDGGSYNVVQFKTGGVYYEVIMKV